MALSNLLQVKTGENPAYTAYNPAPTSSYNGTSPETEVGFVILGYLTANTNIMLFQVSASVATLAALSINTAVQTDAITVADTRGSNTNPQTNNYTVDFGQDTSAKEWTLNFNITLKDGSTGSWVFTKKGVGEEPNPSYGQPK